MAEFNAVEDTPSLLNFPVLDVKQAKKDFDRAQGREILISYLIIRKLIFMTELTPDPQKPALGHLLAKVSRLVGNRMRMKLEGIGLQHAQGMLLFHLWHQDGMAQNLLARALHITPPTATSTLQRMERDGWIERRRDAPDQRVVRVYLTGKARALRREAGAAFRELDGELTDVLTDTERGLLVALLSKVHWQLSRAEQGGDGPISLRRAPAEGVEEKR
jgi:MarR family transcriptional regulator, organic hydroperoxide resistance regulator